MTHIEKRKRIKQAVAAVESGESPHSVAERYGLTPTYVEISARAEGVFRKRRADRDKKISDAIKRGESVADLVGQFGYSYEFFRHFARLRGLKLVQERREKLSAYKVIADLLNTDDSYGAIGLRNGITKQRVDQIASKCRAVGISFPHRGRNSTREHHP